MTRTPKKCSKRADCPHARISHCPLFVESHNTRQLGCVDRMDDDCQVVRGLMDYDEAVAKLEQVDPLVVAHCEYLERAFEKSQQRARNMRVNGIH